MYLKITELVCANFFSQFQLLTNIDLKKIKNIYIKSQGKYKVSVLDQGCSISDSLEAFYFTKPLDPGFKKDTSGCFGGDVRLNALNNSSFNFLWSTGEISQEITVKTPGKYNVQISNSGCKSSFSSNINFHPPLEFPENNPETLCESDNQTITLSAGKGKNFKWDQSTLTNQVLVVGKAGSYTVTKFDIVTGCKESSIFNVKNICEPRLYFPTAFTPNQDGDNELFKPSFKNVGTYQINIYSRWGELIYYSENIEQGWDGTYKGQPAPVDNYIYTVNFEGENSAPNLKGTLKGSLILIR